MDGAAEGVRQSIEPGVEATHEPISEAKLAGRMAAALSGLRPRPAMATDMYPITQGVK